MQHVTCLKTHCNDALPTRDQQKRAWWMFHLIIFLRVYYVHLVVHPNLFFYGSMIKAILYIYHIINLPGQPIQVKDIIFLRPLNAATKPPEDILNANSFVLGSLFTVTGNRLETTSKRRFLSLLLSLDILV